MSNPYLILGQAGGNGMQTLVVMGLLFAIMYFLVFRPQRKQMAEQKAMLAALKKGDDVVTQSGILGKIFAVTEKLVTLEVANNVRIRVLKSSIQGKMGAVEEPKPEEKAGEKREEK